MGIFETEELKTMAEGEKSVQLVDTVELMCSDKWYERFIAEYTQLVVRMRDLDKYLPNVSDREEKQLLIEQYNIMSQYEQILFERAERLGIELATWEKLGYGE